MQRPMITMTGLVDRSLFEERIEQRLKDRRGQGRLTVCFLDLDDFAMVNDSFGHEAGDALLVEVGSRLSRSVRDGDTVARISGDEFGILLPSVTDVEVITRVMHQVVSKIATPWTWDGHELEIGVSIGVAIAPQDGEDARTLIRAADEAMYRAKRAGEVLRFA